MPVASGARAAARWAVIALVGGLLAACEDGTSPPPREHAHRLLVPGTEAAAGLVVDLDRGSVVRRMGAGLFAEQTHALLSADGAQFVVIGRTAAGEWLLVGFGVATGNELWRQSLTVGNQPVMVDGVALGRTAVALHPSRPEVFLARSSAGAVSGVAVFDYQTKRVLDLIVLESGRIRSLETVTRAGSDVCVVAAADSGQQASTRAYLVAACGTDYAERDTVVISLPSQTVVQMELTPDRSRVLLGTNTELMLVDPSAWQVMRRAARPISSPFFTSGATGTLYLPDAGNASVASSGIIYALDAGLETAAIYDLGVLTLDERPQGVHGGAASLDGRWLYLVGGVDRVGTVYGPEETRVFILDLSTGMLVGKIALGTVGGRRPFLVP